MKRSTSLLAITTTLVLAIAACKGEQRPDGQPDGAVAVENIDVAPPVTSADEQYANVYEPLDGRWKGTFRIYVDDRGQVEGPRPTALDPLAFETAPYVLSQTIEVEQRYVSESPYFQRVEITDTYPDGRVVKSRGVNKVQNGEMWCVVKKPDDLVVHSGKTDGDRTIIWSRDRQSPKAIEWFHETVDAESYSIVGWGYYGSDDPELRPRMFFHGEYERVE